MRKGYEPDRERVNPFRELDWRWRRAERLVSEGRPFLPRRDDAATGRCVAYLRDQKQRRDLARRHPDLHAAHTVWAADGDLRAALEARILAGQSDAEIAQAICMTPEGVGTFHDSFFDVRDLVAKRATDWLMIRACGHVPGNPAVESPRVLLRMLGLFAGPHVLDSAVPFLIGGFELASDAVPTGVEPALARSIKQTLRMMLLPDTDETRGRFVQASAMLAAGCEPTEVGDWVLDPPRKGRRPRGATTRPSRSGAAAVVLHKKGELGNGLGAPEGIDQDLLLHGPPRRVKGEENVPRRRSGRTDGGPSGGRAVYGTGAGRPGGVGAENADAPG